MHPRLKARRSSHSGMTLIEIMVVVFIAAMMSTGMVMGFQALNRTNLKSACMKVLAASRFAYGRAVTRGNTVRVLLDMENNTLAIEEAHGSVTLSSGTKRILGKEVQTDSGAVDPWEAARASLEKGLTPGEAISPFEAVTDADGHPVSRFLAKPLPGGVKARKFIAPYREDPIENGKVALYFFPGGYNDRSVLQLAQGETVYSVEVFPMSGHGRVHNYAYEPSPIDMQESDVEDPE